MSFKIYLNDMKYRFDVYHIVNVFYGNEILEFTNEQECSLHIEINADHIIINGNFKAFSKDVHSTVKEELKKAVFEYLAKETEIKHPWGILNGIRPSKIALELINEGKSNDEIISFFYEHFYASREKAELCIQIAALEKKFVNSESHKISVYIGMPFCPTRCIYCSFTSNTIAKCSKLIEPYIAALKCEIRAVTDYIKKSNLKLQCVYFGGGTPTSINDTQFEDLMNFIYKTLVLDSDIEEFTVECGRPDSITANKLEAMKKNKVDRISINPQTMNDNTLKLIGRTHSVSEVIRKFELARSIGFDNINMDIIVGLPWERTLQIQNTCHEIEKLSPDSITVHGLSIKRGSQLHEEMLKNKLIKIAPQSELINMYQQTSYLAKKLNMHPYYMYRQKNMVGNMENVGYCTDYKEGIYNIQMIEERQSIVACGAGAVSKIVFLKENRFERQFNVKDVREYINRVDEMIEKKCKLLDTLYSTKKEEG
jgi:coproporphyrinogen dehydrogenase HemZ